MVAFSQLLQRTFLFSVKYVSCTIQIYVNRYLLVKASAGKLFAFTGNRSSSPANRNLSNRPYRLFVFTQYSLNSMLKYFSMSSTDGYIPIFSYTKLFLVDLRHNEKGCIQSYCAGNLSKCFVRKRGHWVKVNNR